MPRKLLIINVLLLLIAGASLAFIARQLMTPTPMPMPARTRPTNPTPPARGEEAGPGLGGAYTSVAARNLFSPTRTEAPPTTTTAATSPAVKPNLFGIILRDGAPVAYLEDPTTKRVAGYRVGDTMAGGTVQTISADSVVIARPDGNMDVRLRDPGKPRAAPVAAAPGAPAAQPVAGAAALPGVIPPAPGVLVPGAGLAQPPGVAPPPGQAVQPTAPPLVPGRRPLPPNLLRRLPQGSPTDAPQQ
jgi:Type II secretion system protein C